MNWRVIVLLAVLADFLAFTGYVLAEYGFVGLWLAAFDNVAAMQVLFDLVVACLLISAWMVRDAAKRGWNPWPFVVLTLATGSVGPLVYLIRREWGRPAAVTA
jgi:hypothetical protein